jgi:M6 family metalloprotease-like protein
MGYYLPAFDTIRSLIIFAQYPSWVLDTDRWPFNSKEVPAFGKRLLASSAVDMSTDSSLTAYLLEASLGRLFFTGTYYPEVVTLDHDMNHYDKSGQLGEIVYEVLDKVNRSGKIQWEQYDNWGKYKDRWRKQPDGVIDNILVVFRDDPQSLGPYAWVGTGGGIAALLCRDYKINDKLLIRGGSMGSGVIVNAGAEYFQRFFKLLKHELAHYFTLDHYAGLNGFWGPDFTNHGAWGLAAAHGSSSIAVNSWDRDRLGWSKFMYDTDARGAKDTIIELRDFITTGEAARIRLPYVDDEYFLLEYHNNTGWFDEVDVKQDGLYILHQSGRPENHLDCEELDCEEADGRWDFVMSDSLELNAPCCGRQPMTKRLEPNPFLGFGDRDDLRILKNKTDEKLRMDNMQRALAFVIEGEEREIRCNGDGNDGFTTEKGRNEFSIGTNPSSASNGIRTHTLTTHLNGIQVRVLKMEKDKLTVQLRFHYFHISRNVRWTGSIVLYDQLIVDRGKELFLDRSETFNKIGEALPLTSLVVKEKGSITVERNGRLYLDKGSSIVLMGNAKIYLKEGARLILKGGSRIIGDPSRIIRSKGAMVINR